MNTLTTTRSEELMHLEDRYGAHNYHPVPVVLERGEGVTRDLAEAARLYRTAAEQATALQASVAK